MNAHLQKALSDAAEVATQLSERGIVVLRVLVESFGGRPTIEVAASPLCEELRGTPTLEVTDDGRREQWAVTHIGGCRVQWRFS
jgi:hypothetical protein